MLRLYTDLVCAMKFRTYRRNNKINTVSMGDYGVVWTNLTRLKVWVIKYVTTSRAGDIENRFLRLLLLILSTPKEVKVSHRLLRLDRKITHWNAGSKKKILLSKYPKPIRRTYFSVAVESLPPSPLPPPPKETNKRNNNYSNKTPGKRSG